LPACQSTASKHLPLRLKLALNDYSRRHQARLLSTKCVPTLTLPFTRYPHSESVIEAGDVGNTIRTPALYVRVASSGIKVSKTAIIRSTAPTWEHACPMYVPVISPVSMLTCVFQNGRIVFRPVSPPQALSQIVLSYSAWFCEHHHPRAAGSMQEYST